MRQISYTLISAFLLGLVSCAENDIDGVYRSETSDQSINFTNTTVDPETKAMINTGNFADGESIGIHAYYFDDGESWDSDNSIANYMYDQELTYIKDNDYWSYSPKRYWPSNLDEKIKFFAYYPYAEDSKGLISINDSDHTGSPTLTYSVPQLCTDQLDVLVAQTEAINNSDTAAAVPLDMVHALSQISFQAKLAKEGATTVYISGVKILGVKNAGTLDMEQLTWSVPTDDTEDGFESAAILYLGDEVDGKAPEYRKISSTTATTDLTANDGYLLMMPQKDMSAAKAVVTFANIDDGTVTYNDITYDLPNIAWEPNTHYKYIFAFDSQTATVTVEVTAEWLMAEIPIDVKGVTYDYTPAEMGRSNCYFIHPMPVEQTLYIPIDRIDAFWGNEGYENNENYMIDGNGDTESEVIWGRQFDVDDVNTNYSSFDWDTSGSDFSAAERKAVIRQNDYAPEDNDGETKDNITHKITTSPSGNPAIEITVPANCPEGNLLIGVFNPNNTNSTDYSIDHNYSWSWHFWITDYNPDQVVTDNLATIENGKNKNTWTGSQGSVIRLTPDNDGDLNPDYIWSKGNSYYGKVMMDRNIGAGEDNVKSAMRYQFGRKDPIRPMVYKNTWYNWGTTGNQYYYINCKGNRSVSSFKDAEYDAEDMGESVNDPVLLFGRDNVTLSMWLDPNSGKNDKYLDAHVVWHDPYKRSETDDFDNIERKSIFDPSPLGWMVPNLKAYQYLVDDGVNQTIKERTNNGNSYIGLLYYGLEFRANYYLNSSNLVSSYNNSTDKDNQDSWFTTEIHLASNAPVPDEDDTMGTAVSQIYTFAAFDTDGHADATSGSGDTNHYANYDEQHRIDAVMVRCVQE
ncbi:MAG: fimbrillin family protein [Rikenellaceae bacterium]